MKNKNAAATQSKGSARRAAPQRRPCGFRQLLAYGTDRVQEDLTAVRVKVSRPRGNKGGRIGGRRGEIGGYTPASQGRFRRAIWAVGAVLKPHLRGNRCHYPASFLTLTYPSTWHPDPRKWKQHLDLWFQRLKRRHGNAWAIWALEFQARQAPHFHLIVCWGGSRPKETWKERQQWISSSWASVVGDGEPQPGHRRAGTQVRPLSSATRVCDYITKRQTKDVVVPEGFGRWWGKHNGEAYEAVAVRVQVLVAQEVIAKVAGKIEEKWRRKWRIGEDVETYKIPAWASGRAANDVLHAAGARDAVFDADWVDLRSGEVVAANDNETASSQTNPPPAVSPRLEPRDLVPAAPSKGSPSAAESGKLVNCEKCGSVQTRLVDGMCRVCEGL